jgi:rubrerythrin
MHLELNIDEIFRIAAKIEENGARFYNLASEVLTDQDASWEFLELAEQELEHKKVFETMREAYIKSGPKLSVETAEYNDLFLQSWADGHIFRLDKDPFATLTGDETTSDVLKIAIDAEKDSIVFFLAIKEALTSQDDRDKIDRLIWEELNHFATLSNKLSTIDGTTN